MMAAISSNGTPKMSWSTNASRSAGVSVSSTTSSARPDEVGHQRLVLGVGAVGAVEDRLGHVDASRGWLASSARERSTFNETRPTTVVNHAPRFSTSLALLRLSRSQAS